MELLLFPVLILFSVGFYLAARINLIVLFICEVRIKHRALYNHLPSFSEMLFSLDGMLGSLDKQKWLRRAEINKLISGV